MWMAYRQQRTSRRQAVMGLEAAEEALEDTVVAVMGLEATTHCQ